MQSLEPISDVQTQFLSEKTITDPLKTGILLQNIYIVLCNGFGCVSPASCPGPLPVADTFQYQPMEVREKAHLP